MIKEKGNLIYQIKKIKEMMTQQIKEANIKKSFLIKNLEDLKNQENLLKQSRQKEDESFREMQMKNHLEV